MNVTWKTTGPNRLVITKSAGQVFLTCPHHGQVISMRSQEHAEECQDKRTCPQCRNMILGQGEINVPNDTDPMEAHRQAQEAAKAHFGGTLPKNSVTLTAREG